MRFLLTLLAGTIAAVTLSCAVILVSIASDLETDRQRVRAGYMRVDGARYVVVERPMLRGMLP